MSEAQFRAINLALQGGGAHGAFTWGVLDYLLEDARVTFEGISATSAGAMNAVVYAYGNMRGGRDGARQALHDFWRHVSRSAAAYSPLSLTPVERLLGIKPEQSASYVAFESLTRSFSPYQLNPLNINPLRDVLAACVDFDELRRCQCSKLFLSATNIRTGNVRVFRNEELSIDAVLASACLPNLFQAIEIDGAFYWDGGYMGNPSLFPLFYNTDSRDVVVVHINPIFNQQIPRSAAEIADRVNEITFNSALLKEFRAVAFVTKLIEDGWIKDEYRARLRHMLIHSIRADDALNALGAASKFNTEWRFLTDLRDRGRATAAQWLAENFIHLGKRATVDLAEEYLNPRNA
ncbi:MAG: patatin-like phospholipase family protein [Proteobacteria bacterium]|nr:patatin-like phospholipase family protein [Pseudomonadota bacterium]